MFVLSLLFIHKQHTQTNVFSPSELPQESSANIGVGTDHIRPQVDK